jgi:hypothetical protein
MKTNKHFLPIQEKKMESIAKSLEELREVISSHVTPLTPRERQMLPKMGDKTLAFVKKCYEFTQKNPEFCPNYFDMDAFEVDFKDAEGLYSIINMAKQIQENLVDIQMSAGSEAFQAALLYYTTVKKAAANDIPGAKTIYEELRKRFPSGRRKTPQEDSSQAGEQTV